MALLLNRVQHRVHNQKSTPVPTKNLHSGARNGHSKLISKPRTVTGSCPLMQDTHTHKRSFRATRKGIASSMGRWEQDKVAILPRTPHYYLPSPHPQYR
uniref:Uncharacterized protein n=1 Tax=Arundo donax TaxID=35708 RepID=A0A0A8Y0V7_ARUDO